MKKSIAAISLLMFTGCHVYKKGYNEIELIEIANERLEEIYEIKIEER